MLAFIRKVVDLIAIAGFVLLLTYLYRNELAGTFIGDMWEGILQKF